MLEVTIYIVLYITALYLPSVYERVYNNFGNIRKFIHS